MYCSSTGQWIKQLFGVQATFYWQAKPEKHTGDRLLETGFTADQSKFELFGQKRRSRFWRASGETQKNRYIQKAIDREGGNIMIWRAFPWSGVGSLTHIKGIMSADIYIDLLCENLEVSLSRTGLETNYILQQDNNPKHIAKKSTAFFKSN